MDLYLGRWVIQSKVSLQFSSAQIIIIDGPSQ